MSEGSLSFDQQRQQETEHILKQIQITEGLESLVDSQLIAQIWNSFGRYISNQMLNGRSVIVKNLGQFNFSHPEFQLAGATNPEERNKLSRVPVFLIDSSFVKGRKIKKGIYTNQGIRVYGNQGINGSVQQVMANYSQIGVYSSVSKDVAKTVVERVIAQIRDNYQQNGSVSINIPSLGTLMIRNDIGCVSFNYSLRINAINVRQNIRNKKSNLSQDNLRIFECMSQQQDQSDECISLNSSARSYLANNLGIQIGSITATNNKQMIDSGYNVQINNENRKNLAADLRSVSSSSVQKRPVSSEQLLFTKKKMLAQYSDPQLGMRRLKEYLRANNCDNEEGFANIVQAAKGNCYFNSKLDQKQFMKGIQMLDIELNQQQINGLFDYLDVNHDGYLDFNDFSKMVVVENNVLQKLRDVIQQNNLETDDVLVRMNLNRDAQKIDRMSLLQKIMNLNELLDFKKSQKAVEQIMKGKTYIDVESLLQILEINDDERKVYNINWYKNILIKLRQQLSTEKFDKLYSQFEKQDIRSQGILDIASFKTVWLKAKLGLSVEDVNKMVRYAQKRHGLIDYTAVMNDLYNSTRQKDKYFYDIEDFTLQLKEYIWNRFGEQKEQPQMMNDLHRNYFNKNILVSQKMIQQLIRNIDQAGKRVQVNIFGKYLKKVLFQECSLNEIIDHLKLIDLDGDGAISVIEIDNFLQKYRYKKNSLDVAHRSKYFQNNPIGQKNDLYPHKNVSEQEIHVVLKDLRYTMNQRKMSNIDLFQKLDKNQDGFVTFEEFERNIESVIILSQKTKEQLFSFFDQSNIGVFNYQTMVDKLEKSVSMNKVDDRLDDYSQQDQIIEEIREWFRRSKISVEQAFKLIDSDFDGQIDKNDLRRFMVNNLQYQDSNITSLNIDRLFKVMDQYKRNYIQLIDFKRLITENELDKQKDNKSCFINYLKTSITHGNQEQSNSFDWLANAKQQIGLVMSRKFASFVEGFDMISGHKNRMIYSQFKEWIEKNQVLNGFNLTDILLQELFSSLDPHKKGYLTINDWKSKFENYNWQSQMAIEIKYCINENFESISKAFQYFSQGEPSISKEHFMQAIQNIFPNRFNQNDLNWYWCSISQQKGKIDYIVFENKYQDVQTKSKLLNKFKSLTSNNFYSNKDDILKSQKYRKIVNQINDPFKKDDFDTIFGKVKNLIRASNKSIDDLFKEYIDEGISRLSYVQFRNIFKKMNLGLSIREFDQLIDQCQNDKDGYVDIMNLKKRLQISRMDEQIIRRSRQRISEIRQDIYDFMCSPASAFRTFDSKGRNKLSFEQFQSMMNRLNKLAGKETLNFSILKDLFEFIDLRKNNCISLNEFLQVFKYPSQISVKQMSQSSNKLSQKLTDMVDNQQRLQLNKNKPLKRISSSIHGPIYDHVKAEASKELDQITKIIGKNRKYLFDLFKNYEQVENRKISFELVKKHIEELLRNSGYKVGGSFWPILLKFANKKGIINYRFLLETYKQKEEKIEPIPKLVK